MRLVFFFRERNCIFISGILFEFWFSIPIIILSSLQGFEGALEVANWD